MTRLVPHNDNSNDHHRNLDFLFSEPLLDAALTQIKTMAQFRALQENFDVAAAAGSTIPDSITAKLQDKQRQLSVSLVQDATHAYLQQSGLDDLVVAKGKWDDVHFMAEAHGVGSSIPMVGYTGLSQTELEEGLAQFYRYIIDHKVPADLEPEVRQQVGQQIVQAYRDLHDGATGEFGGYEPFESLRDHSPARVEQTILEEE